MRPGGSVEALDHAAQRQVGIVVDLHRGERTAGRSGRSDQLPERLDAVEGTPLVVAHNRNALLTDAQCVGSREGLHARAGGRLGAEVDVDHGTAAIGFEKVHVLGEGLAAVLHGNAARKVEPLCGVDLEAVRRGVDDDAAVVDHVAGDFAYVLRFGALRREVEALLLGLQRAPADKAGGQQREQFSEVGHVFGFLG